MGLAAPVAALSRAQAFSTRASAERPSAGKCASAPRSAIPRAASAWRSDSSSRCAASGVDAAQQDLEGPRAVSPEHVERTQGAARHLGERVAGHRRVHVDACDRKPRQPLLGQVALLGEARLEVAVAPDPPSRPPAATALQHQHGGAEQRSLARRQVRPLVGADALAANLDAVPAAEVGDADGAGRYLQLRVTGGGAGISQRNIGFAAAADEQVPGLGQVVGGDVLTFDHQELKGALWTVSPLRERARNIRHAPIACTSFAFDSATTPRVSRSNVEQIAQRAQRSIPAFGIAPQRSA